MKLTNKRRLLIHTMQSHEPQIAHGSITIKPTSLSTISHEPTPKEDPRKFDSVKAFLRKSPKASEKFFKALGSKTRIPSQISIPNMYSKESLMPTFEKGKSPLYRTWDKQGGYLRAQGIASGIHINTQNLSFHHKRQGSTKSNHQASAFSGAAGESKINFTSRALEAKSIFNRKFNIYKR